MKEQRLPISLLSEGNMQLTFMFAILADKKIKQKSFKAHYNSIIKVSNVKKTHKKIILKM